MALVRRGSKVYWYESFRSGGRVTSRYVGSGTLAEACACLATHRKDQDARVRAVYRRKNAALDARFRKHTARVRQARIDDRASAEAADGLMAEWYGRVEGAFREAMAAAGCHQHKGTWRRR